MWCMSHIFWPLFVSVRICSNVLTFSTNLCNNACYTVTQATSNPEATNVLIVNSCVPLLGLLFFYDIQTPFLISIIDHNSGCKEPWRKRTQSTNELFSPGFRYMSPFSRTRTDQGCYYGSQYGWKNSHDICSVSSRVSEQSHSCWHVAD